jgi:hypothetical protein
MVGPPSDAFTAALLRKFRLLQICNAGGEKRDFPMIS